MLEDWEGSEFRYRKLVIFEPISRYEMEDRVLSMVLKHSTYGWLEVSRVNKFMYLRLPAVADKLNSKFSIFEYFSFFGTISTVMMICISSWEAWMLRMPALSIDIGPVYSV